MGLNKFEVLIQLNYYDNMLNYGMLLIINYFDHSKLPRRLNIDNKFLINIFPGLSLYLVYYIYCL